MQSLWQGKGDLKLLRVTPSTGDGGVGDGGGASGERDQVGPSAGGGPGPVRTGATPRYKYSEYGFRDEEKFTVLPKDVRSRIESLVLDWLLNDPKRRLCLGDALGMALTLLAHATHHIHMSWTPFNDVVLDDATLMRAIRCFKTSVPEPGTFVGEIVAQFFQHCKQQSNLNVKRKCTAEAPETKATVTTEENVSPPSIVAGTEPEPKTVRHNKRDGSSSKRSGIDRKFETIMSLKRSSSATIMFRIFQRVPLPDNGEDTLVDYLEKRVFGTLCYPDGRDHLSRIEHTLSVRQFTNEPDKDVYFSLKVERNTRYDEVLDRVFESVHLYNASLDRVNHRMGECNAVYCSDTVYFMDISKRLFVDNSVTFIYCFLTDKYKPVIESREDTDTFGLAKILSSVEYSTKCSLKRNHSNRMGYGPLTSVISEGGLNESSKFVNNLARQYILSGDGGGEDTVVNCFDPQSPSYAPEDPAPSGLPAEAIIHQSPTYSPDSPPPPSTTRPSPDDNATETRDDKAVKGGRVYVINEPYINAFLNRPVECGNMY